MLLLGDQTLCRGFALTVDCTVPQTPYVCSPKKF